MLHTTIWHALSVLLDFRPLACHACRIILTVAFTTGHHAIPAPLDIAFPIPYVWQIFAIPSLDNHALHVAHRLLALNVAQHTPSKIIHASLLLLVAVVTT